MLDLKCTDLMIINGKKEELEIWKYLETLIQNKTE